MKLPDQSHDFALKARELKQAAAEAMGVDSDYVSSLVERFYAKVREDDLLGPIFAERVKDWPAHLARMKRFWRSVLHNSGEYRGRPMAIHIAIGDLGAMHFSRWLSLFYDTLREEEPSEQATRSVGATARNIADSLLTGIALHEGGIGSLRPAEELPHV